MKILSEKEATGIFLRNSKILNEILSGMDIDIDPMILKPEWNSYRIKLRRNFNSIDLNFLNNSGIGGMMFQSDVNITNHEIKLIDEEILKNVKEYQFSNPNYQTKNGLLSTNTIHHLYHIDNFIKNKKDSKIENILEWGGGYGNMCKIFFEVFDNIKKYTLVDIPEFLTLQYLYLTSYFGEDNVRIIKNISESSEGINLISVSDFMKNKVPEFDLFISNWAISESEISCQEFLEDNGVFEYKNQLISFHQCGYHIPFMKESEILFERLKNKKDYHIISIDIIPGVNYYAIK